MISSVRITQASIFLPFLAPSQFHFAFLKKPKNRGRDCAHFDPFFVIFEQVAVVLWWFEVGVSITGFAGW
jgi:hypothetical protein